jgi:integrase
MPSTTVRINNANLSKLTCPPGKPEQFFWDDDLPGFGLRAYKSGKRQFIAQYRDANGRTRRAPFGDAKTVKPEDARDAAKKLLSKVELGQDPQAERRAARQAIRVGALVESYLADAEKRLRPRSYDEVKRHLKTHAKPLHGDAVGTVGRAEIAAALTRIATKGGPVVANRVRSSLSAMFVWGLRSGTIDGDNPVANVPKPAKETPRERVLSDGELALIWDATTHDQDHDRIVRLLLLTGARRDEVASAEWSEIDGTIWTLPRARSKNGLPHEVALGPLALAQLPAKREKRDLIFGEGKGGFSGWSRCKERLDARIEKARADAFTEAHGRAPTADDMPATNWTLHDLRRTLSTWLSETGTEPHVVEALLNHVSGVAKRGVAGVYNKASYREAKRAALARWEAHVRGIVGLPAVEPN